MTAAMTQHRTILVVEDEPDIASFLEMALEFEGYQVKTARRGSAPRGSDLTNATPT